ncbi:MAG: cohesin domain-containing protein [Acutalibacteraceae bacterium]
MKKTAKVIISTVMCLLVILMSTVSCFAADTLVNGKTAKVGDKVTYTLNLSDLVYPLAGVQMYVYYDASKLKVVEGSLESETLKSAVTNERFNEQGKMIFLWTEGVMGEKFEEPKQLLTVQFEVIGEGASDITYNIQEMYDIYYDRGSGEYLQRYTLTNTVDINGTKVIENEPPILNENVSADEKGDFVNNKEGKGEKNGVPVEKDDPVQTYTVNTTVINGSTAVVDKNGNVVNNSVDLNSVTQPQNTNKSAEFDPTTVFVGIAVSVLVVAIIVLLVVKKKK